MPYRYATTKEDYARLASGQVFYHLSGLPVFPVRLMSEIYQLCLDIRRRDGIDSPCTIYDPCCGAACHLCTLAFLHWNEIAAILCSDIDGSIVDAAESNLSLLTAAGMDRRCAELAAMADAYGKVSHAQALAYARDLRTELQGLLQHHAVSTHAFQANVFQQSALCERLNGRHIDIVFADVPYGLHSCWEGGNEASETPPMETLLDSLRHVITPATIVAIASTKQDRVAHAGYTRIKRIQLGKRMVTLLKTAHP